MRNKNFFPKSIIVIILLFINSIIGYSQSVWYKTFGSWNECEQAQRVVQTYDGGYVILTLQRCTSPGYYNIFKLDNSGNLLWRKLLADSSNKNILEMQQTSDSGFIFGGWCGYSPYGGVLIKVNKNGNFKWQKNYTNLSYQTRFNTVKQTIDNGFICCGFYPDFINGGEKGVAVKTDSLGNVQWEKQYLDSLINNYSDIIQDSLNNYYINGFVYNIIDSVYSIIKKLNYNGNVIWTKIYGYNTWGKYIFNIHNNFITSIGASANNPNNIPILTKIDTSGNIKWSNSYPFQLYDLYACKDNFDNITLSGNVDTNNIETIRIKKIDSSGIIIKNRLLQFSSFNYIASQCIKTTNDLGFIISGTATKIDSINNNHDYSLVVKTDSIFNTPIIINKINNNISSIVKDFKLYQNYPNPFNSTTIFKFLLPNNGFIDLSIFDILGKKVFSKKKYFNKGFIEYNVDFNEQKLSSGVYFARVNFGSDSKLIKLIYLK